MKRLRILGKVVEMVLSASRLVDIYRPGKIGAPAAAEIYAKEPNPALRRLLREYDSRVSVHELVRDLTVFLSRPNALSICLVLTG